MMRRGGLPMYRRQAMYRAIEADNARAEMGRMSMPIASAPIQPTHEDHRDPIEMARVANAALKGA